MRGLLLAVVGLALGAVAALGYSHYLGEGKQLADAQAALAEAQSNLAKAMSDTKEAKSENTALSDQVQQLQAGKADLQKQLDAAKTAAATPAPAPAANPFSSLMNNGLVKQVMANQSESKLLKWKTRLHLTPDQIATVKAALDAEQDRTAAMTQKILAGGKVDFQSMAAQGNAQSADQVLQSVLTPDQKTAYQQMQADDKNNAAESMASMQLNQMSNVIQLSDSQKDQVYNALAQAQLQTQDPNWIKANVNPSDPMAIMDAQAKAKDDALSKILTPDQFATYQQQEQSQLQMQKAMMKNFSAGGASPFGAVAAPAAPASTAPAPAPATGQ